jgi:hypothetical protein
MEQATLHPLPPDVLEEPEVIDLTQPGGSNQVESPPPSSPTVAPDRPA